jgi:hypothetical protein
VDPRERAIRWGSSFGADTLSAQNYSYTTASPAFQTSRVGNYIPMSRSRWVSDAPDKLLAWFNRMIRRANLKGQKNTLGKRFGYLHTVCAAFLLYHSFTSRLNGSGGKKHTTESAAPGLRRTRSTAVVIQQRDLGCEPNGKKW